MPKKTKLGSANPKYHKVKAVRHTEIITRRWECEAAIRDSSGNIVPGKTASVHSIWSKKK